ncbi:sulfatase-like hydrolase/transferase [Leptospira sarikeiensis]|uniref:sulfatase-like hydrolase/transferase n=1 Tax=Leptospira sarikeiensis TaxID=2484943 RepID=UPI001438365C|nr:sulfatase-like hydrolase/transferase [Leptospira sarikeiensis]
MFSDKLVSNPNKMVLDRFSRSNSNTKPQRNKNIIIFLLEGISKEAFTKVDLSSFKNWEEIEYFFVPIPHSSNSLFSLITGNYSDSRREPNSENTKSAQPITSEFERAGYKIRFLFSGAGYFENIQRMMQDWRIPLYDRNYFRNNAKKNYKEFQWGLEDSVLIDFASDFSQLDPSPYLYILYFTNTHSPYFNPHPEKFYRFEEDSDYGRYLNSLEYELHLVDSFVRKNEDRFPNQTIYLLLSDHGESFGKFGVYKHGFSIKNEEVRVPFLYYSPEFSIPSAEKGGIHDVFPSLLELLDFGSYKEKNGTSFFDPDYEFRMPLYPWGPRSSKGVLYKDKKYILEENSRSLIESDLDESEMKESRDPNILKLLQKL